MSHFRRKCKQKSSFVLVNGIKKCSILTSFPAKAAAKATLTDDDEHDDVNGILVPHMTIVNSSTRSGIISCDGSVLCGSSVFSALVGHATKLPYSIYCAITGETNEQSRARA